MSLLWLFDRESKFGFRVPIGKRKYLIWVLPCKKKENRVL